MDAVALLSPMTGMRTVSGVGTVLATSFDNQQAIFLPGIICLIPLVFVITHKALFKVPSGRVRMSVLIKLITPHQRPFL